MPQTHRYLFVLTRFPALLEVRTFRSTVRGVEILYEFTFATDVSREYNALRKYSASFQPLWTHCLRPGNEWMSL